MSDLPLRGRLVAVTRARTQASVLSERLAALGAGVVELPAIAIEPPPSYDPLDRELSRLAAFNWLVVTSANTPPVLAQRLAVLGPVAPPPAQLRVAAVGPATAAALREAGFAVDLVPETAVGEALGVALAPRVQGKRVLLPRAEVAREVLPQMLRDAGAEVVIVPAYRTVADGAAADRLAEVLETLDAVTFASSSSVGSFFALLGQTGKLWPAGLKAFTIGPVTSAALREHGMEPANEAVQHTLEGLIEAVLHGLPRDATESE